MLKIVSRLLDIFLQLNTCFPLHTYLKFAWQSYLYRYTGLTGANCSKKSERKIGDLHFYFLYFKFCLEPFLVRLSKCVWRDSIYVSSKRHNTAKNNEKIFLIFFYYSKFWKKSRRKIPEKNPYQKFLTSEIKKKLCVFLCHVKLCCFVLFHQHNTG